MGTKTVKTVNVVTGHFKSGPKAADRFVKPIHFRELTKYFKKHGLNDNPLILSCDLNTNRHSPSFKEFEAEHIRGGRLKTAYVLEHNKFAKETNPQGRYTASKWRRG